MIVILQTNLLLSKTNKVFEGGGIHPFNSPLPPPSNGKRNLKIFKTTDYSRKRKEIHQLTAYIWLRLLYKSLHPYFAPLRSAKHQIYANVKRNWQERRRAIALRITWLSKMDCLAECPPPLSRQLSFNTLYEVPFRLFILFF